MKKLKIKKKMKNQTLKGLAVVLAASSLTTSCDLLKDLKYTVTPNPLEMHGDSVRVNAEVTFPEKGINKKAIAQITPMIGTHAMKTITVQGEKAEGNGQVIEYKPGGTVKYTDIIAYSPDMEVSELKVTGTVSKGKKSEAIDEMKIADATIVTPLLVQKDDKVLIGSDQFKRVTEEVFAAQINYLKGKSDVRASEYKDADIKAMSAFLSDAQTNPKIAIKNVNIKAYASPEGEESKNNELSTSRSETGKKASIEIAKKAKNDTVQVDGIYALEAKGEDWAGFKSSLEKSSMNEDEKNLVLRVLSMYNDPAQREQEIKNMSKTFVYLEKNVLPELRRSQINVIYDLTGKSDEELTALSKSNPDSLKVEELLFSATLTDDLNEKLRIYKEVERIYPEDWRGYNNVGYVLYLQGKIDEAKAKFEKANSVMENPQSQNNLGVIARIGGDRAKAKELYTKAMSAGPEVKYNMGIINIQDGKYEDAIANMGDYKTFNKALAQDLSKNYEGALATLDASDVKEDAISYYLRAVVSARQDKLDGIVSNLKSAIAKDASLKEKAMKDREFIKYFENAAFTAIVK
jgi:tetratricopeptide (TPR) repeat protein